MFDKLGKVFSIKTARILAAVVSLVIVIYNIFDVICYGIGYIVFVIPDVCLIVLYATYGILLEKEDKSKAARVFYVICGFLLYEFLYFVATYIFNFTDYQTLIGYGKGQLIYLIFYTLGMALFCVSLALTLIYKLSDNKTFGLIKGGVITLLVSSFIGLVTLVMGIVGMICFDATIMAPLTGLELLFGSLLIANQTYLSGKRDEELKNEKC